MWSSEWHIPAATILTRTSLAFGLVEVDLGDLPLPGLGEEHGGLGLHGRPPIVPDETGSSVWRTGPAPCTAEVGHQCSGRPFPGAAAPRRRRRRPDRRPAGGPTKRTGSSRGRRSNHSSAPGTSAAAASAGRLRRLARARTTAAGAQARRSARASARPPRRCPERRPAGSASGRRDGARSSATVDEPADGGPEERLAEGRHRPGAGRPGRDDRRRHRPAVPAGQRGGRRAVAVALTPARPTTTGRTGWRTAARGS